MGCVAWQIPSCVWPHLVRELWVPNIVAGVFRKSWPIASSSLAGGSDGPKLLHRTAAAPAGSEEWRKSTLHPSLSESDRRDQTMQIPPSTTPSYRQVRMGWQDFADWLDAEMVKKPE